tara:strand:+ start:270 stop:647 length:378 start_codon:yes stop_codon:yes gene_type:complete
MAKRKQLIKKLDAVFSEYIRRRYAKNDVAECFTCGKRDHWKRLQCGHFQSRKHYATRWNEDNCQVQCVGCNVFKSGEQYKFGINLGEKKAKKLFKLARETKKITNFELLEMIEHYKNLNGSLTSS